MFNWKLIDSEATWQFYDWQCYDLMILSLFISFRKRVQKRYISDLKCDHLVIMSHKIGKNYHDLLTCRPLTFSIYHIFNYEDWAWKLGENGWAWKNGENDTIRILLDSRFQRAAKDTHREIWIAIALLIIRITYYKARNKNLWIFFSNSKFWIFQNQLLI